MNSLAIRESEALVLSDLEHIVLSVKHMCEAHNDLAGQMLHNTLQTARGVVEAQGGVRFDEEIRVSWNAVNQFTQEAAPADLPAVYIGSQRLGKNSDPDAPTPIVDFTKGLSVETCTIFQRMNAQGDMLRVATNVMKRNGSRAIGTYIPAINPDGKPNPVLAKILKGEPYTGSAYVVNDWYFTAYEPVFDDARNVAGILYVGVKRSTVEKRLKESIAETRIGKTGYVYILNSKGEYVVSKDNQRNGENLLESRDGDGRYFVKDIIRKANKLGERETFLERYSWKNPGEKAARMKVAKIVYFKDWDWIIAASSYENEFMQTPQKISELGRKSLVKVGLVTLFGIAASLFFSSLISRSITKPINRVVEKLREISRGGGDLTARLPEDDQNEMGELARSFNLFAGTQHAMVKKMAEAADALTSYTMEITATASQLAAGAVEETTAISQVSDTAQEVKQSAMHSSEKAEMVAQEADGVRTVSQSGLEASREAVDGMGRIQEEMASLAHSIENLAEQIKNVEDITNSLNGISSQSDLLSVNASIEAAKAGELGKGFSVVAAEVKHLAEQSKESTVEIRNILKDIQKAAEEAAMASEQSYKAVESGMNLSGKSGRAIQELTDNIEAAVISARQIANAGAQQLAGLEQLDAAMKSIRKSSAQKLDGSRRLEALTHKLSSLAQELESQTGTFIL